MSGSASVSFLLMYFRFFDKNLSLDFKTRKREAMSSISSLLYDVIVETVQMNSARSYRFTVRVKFKSKFHNMTLLGFVNSAFFLNKFPVLSIHALQLINLFEVLVF